MSAALIQAYLEADHRRLERLLAQAQATPGVIEASAFARFRAGLLRHIGLEERLLLPAARRARGGVQVEGFERLRADHARLVSLLVPTPTPALVQEIQAILGPHDQLEEGPQGVYAACEALLGPGKEQLLERLKATPEVPTRPHQDRLFPSRLRGVPEH